MAKKNSILLLVLFLVFTGWNSHARDIDTTKMNKTKAGLLYNMIKMTTWPESSFIASEPISILFLGKDDSEIGSYFKSQVQSRLLTVKGRKLEVSEMPSTKLDDVIRKGLAHCHVLFILSSYKGDIMELLLSLGDRPVLVVGESSSFPAQGGMVGLGIEKKHVTISVNIGAVEKNDLKISAQLLQHANIVETE